MSLTSATKLYKIAKTSEWKKSAESSDKLFRGGPLDLQDKYFHLSTALQVPGTLSLFYRNQGANGALTLVEIDRAAYEDFLKKNGEGELKWEHPPIEGDERLFPHGYSSENGAIPAVVDGVFILRAEVIEEDAENPGSYKTYL